MKFNKATFLAVCALAALTISGCAFTSLFDGKQQTAEQIAATEKAKEKDAAAAAKLEADKAVEAARQAQAAHELEVSRIAREYSKKLRELSSDSTNTAASLQDEFQSRLEQSGDKMVTQVATIKATFDVNTSARDAAITKARNEANAALADIASKQSQWDAGLGLLSNPTVSSAAAASPIGPFITLLGGTAGIGGLIGMFRAKKETAAKTAEAEDAQAAYEKVLADAQSLVRGIEAGKAANPQLSLELKKAAAPILKAITDGAHDLIESKGNPSLAPTT
jgi:hypothetical protein